MSNIIYTKVKFARNLKDIKFESNIDDVEQIEVLKLCKKAIADSGLKCAELKDISNAIVENLIAKDLLDRDFVYASYNQGFANDGNLAVQINAENHIEIIAKDINIYDAYNEAKKIDKKLCNKLNFAYDDKLGFLSPNIKNVGSGLTIKVMAILPALAKINAIESIVKVNEKLMFDIVCLDRQSGLCLISTKCTLGYTEKQICELTNSYINKLINLEIETSKQLVNKDKDEILDASRRAKAILNNCVKITSGEVYILLGNIIVGINSGLENDIQSNQISEILNVVKSYERDAKQLATEIQKILKEKNN